MRYKGTFCTDKSPKQPEKSSYEKELLTYEYLLTSWNFYMHIDLNIICSLSFSFPPPLFWSRAILLFHWHSTASLFRNHFSSASSPLSSVSPSCFSPATIFHFSWPSPPLLHRRHGITVALLMRACVQLWLQRRNDIMSHNLRRSSQRARAGCLQTHQSSHRHAHTHTRQFNNLL